jgi:hypothetical protein
MDTVVHIGNKPAHTDDDTPYIPERSRLWNRLMAVFREEMPSDAALAEVSTLAEIAIDAVFDAHKIDRDHIDQRHGEVKDYADCAALYGYVMGLHRGRTKAI